MFFDYVVQIPQQLYPLVHAFTSPSSELFSFGEYIKIIINFSRILWTLCAGSSIAAFINSTKRNPLGFFTDLISTSSNFFFLFSSWGWLPTLLAHGMLNMVKCAMLTTVVQSVRRYGHFNCFNPYRYVEPHPGKKGRHKTGFKNIC